MNENKLKETGNNLKDMSRVRANLNKIWSMAEKGKSVEDIRQTLNLGDVNGLKNVLVEMMAEKGENMKIDGLDRASVKPAYTDRGIRIDPAMLEGSDYKTGDEFDIEVTPGSIILKKRKI